MNESQRDFQKAKIRLAISEELDDRLDQIDREIAEHGDEARYTLTGEEQLRTMLAIQHSITSQRRSKGRAILLIAVAIASLTLIVSAVYAPLHHVWLKSFGGYTRVSTSDGVTHDWTDAYAPTVFPGDCTQQSIQIIRSQRIVSYMVGNEQLSFSQCRDGNLGIDTETTGAAQEIHQNDFSGWITENDGIRSLYWMQDDFMLTLSGRFTESELLETAQSVQELY